MIDLPLSFWSIVLIMSFLSCKLLPATRNLSPRICKAYLYRTGIQRNYWRRRDAFSELSSAMQSVENYMREMDKEMNRVFGDIQRASPIQLPRLISPLDWGRTRDIPVVSTNGDGKVYKLELDMEGMRPEDIKITLKDKELTITARRDDKHDDGSRFVRENTYQYTLPNEINPDTVRSSLTDGVLIIEAQLPALESKEIPVNIESGQKSSSSEAESKKDK